MNILVTGGCGYIGTVLVNYLLDAGHSVMSLDNLTYGASGLVFLVNQDRFSFLNGDVRDRKDCALACKDKDVVIHLAAIVGERACDKNPDAHDINVQGTKVLYQVAVNRGVGTFIFASTCSNYGVNEQATEEAQLNPLGLYAKTKVETEAWLKAQANSIRVVILRFATAFGLSPRMRFDLLINQFVLDAWEDKKVEVYNRHSWRPFCHVGDISKAIDVVINSCPRIIDNQVFNVGGFNVTKEMLCLQLSTIFSSTEFVYQETGKGRNYSVDFGRIKRLGFEAAKHTSYGMIEMADALRLGVFESPRKLGNDTSH
jgi:nucleoside-diphosphate-sugar epimerase